MVLYFPLHPLLQTSFSLSLSLSTIKVSFEDTSWLGRVVTVIGQDPHNCVNGSKEGRVVKIPSPKRRAILHNADRAHQSVYKHIRRDQALLTGGSYADPPSS
jgi:hypothetical protein